MAFFVPRKAPVHEGRGESGTLYRFEKAVPTEVPEARDIAKFRCQRDVLMEVGPDGDPAEVPRQDPGAMSIRKPGPSLRAADHPKGQPKALQAQEPKKVSRKTRQ